MCAIAQRDDPAQLHVYGGSEQCGSDQDEQDLDNVGTLGPVWRLICRYRAADVPDPFNYISSQSWCFANVMWRNVQRPPTSMGIMIQVRVCMN